MDETYDVVVVGGGAAGLSGAMALGRARRSVLVVDSGEPRNAPAGHVHNYLGREGTPPAELLAIGRAEVAQYGVHVEIGAVATKAGSSDSGFTVHLEGGRQVHARRLLVTTGLVDELPDVPGLSRGWGDDVLHCPYCHGWEVRDQAIGVLGTSAFSVHQALLFRQWTSDLVFFVHDGPGPTAEEREQLAARGIGIVEGPVAGWEDGGAPDAVPESSSPAGRWSCHRPSPLGPRSWNPWDCRPYRRRWAVTSSAPTSPRTRPGSPPCRACGSPATSRTCAAR